MPVRPIARPGQPPALPLRIRQPGLLPTRRILYNLDENQHFNRPYDCGSYMLIETLRGWAHTALGNGDLLLWNSPSPSRIWFGN
jgi:hypothetical protein